MKMEEQEILTTMHDKHAATTKTTQTNGNKQQKRFIFASGRGLL